MLSVPQPRLAKDLQTLMQAGISAGTMTDAEPLTRLEHAFVPGAYARQLWRPKGTLIVGKPHRHPCFNFLMTGHLTVWCNGEVQDVVAPAFWCSGGGAQRVTLAQEDSLLITVHPTTETDLDKLEAELVMPDTGSEPELIGDMK